MATKLVDMGIRRKELNSPGEPSSPKSEKDYEKEKVYPELSLHGPHAEMMGAEDLKSGDLVEQRVRWRVKDHTKTVNGNKTDYRMTLCLEKASDCAECETEKKAPKTDADDGDGADDSPAMAYIKGNAAKG